MADINPEYHDQVAWERTHYKHLYQTIVYGSEIANRQDGVDQRMLDLVKKVPLKRV